MSGTHQTRLDAPSTTDPAVASLSRLIGGPFGRHAVDPPRRRFWIPPRVIMLAAIIMLAVAWMQKLPCANGSWVEFNQYTQLCYSDIRALWGAEHLNEGLVPYFQYPVEYPVLTGVLMAVTGLPAHALLGDGGGPLSYHLNAIVLLMFALGMVAAVYGLRQARRPWDAMLVACAPIIVFTALVNWDLLAVATTVFFLWAWARHKPVAAGILLGIAVGAKFYPLLIVGPLLILAWRYRRIGVALRMTGVAAATWLLVNLPFMIFATDGWLRFFQLNSERGIDWGTSWYILRHIAGDDSTLGQLLNDVDVLNWLYLVAFVICCAGIAWLALTAPTPPRLAQLAFLVVAAFLLTGKVWSQQYVLWLLPLAVLARPQWRAFLAWQAAELFYFVAFYGELLSASGDDEVPAWALVSPEWIFVLASVARLGTVTALCVLVIRDVNRPQHDLIRRSWGFDPDAGPLLTGARVRRPLRIG